MRETTHHRTKKTLVVLAAAALGVGAVGVGANWDHVTSIVGNQFSATTTDIDPEDIGGALLVIAGAPIDHTFDTTKFNQVAEATWTLTNRGTEAAQYAATFEATGDVSQNLAENLDVLYGVTDGSGDVVRWAPAGTIADPVDYALATGRSTVIDGSTTMQIPVRVVLEDPTLLEGEVDTVHDVVADFTVSYMNPSLGS